MTVAALTVCDLMTVLAWHDLGNQHTRNCCETTPEVPSRPITFEVENVSRGQEGTHPV